MEKRYISWEEFHKLTRVLAERVEESGFVPDFLIGITSGGLVPLVLLGALFHTKNVTTISARSYTDKNRGELDIFAKPDVRLEGRRVLVVDEIADSGETLRQVIGLLTERYRATEVRSAVVVVNVKRNAYRPDYFVEETDRWVVFPWDE